MKRIVTTYDMMISSPSDTAKEVAAIFESVMDFNRSTANRENAAVMVRVVKWSTDAFLNSRKTTQESINEQIVAECDFAVAVFHHRLGTAVDQDISRTAQEIRLLLEHKKQVFIFCLAKSARGSLPRGKSEEERAEIKKQYNDLQAYMKSLDEKEIPVHTYTDAADLRNQVLNQLLLFDLLKNAPDLQAASPLGICSMAAGSADGRKLKEKIGQARHIKIFATTGGALFHANTNEFVKMLRNGGTLKVLLPNPESEFLKDIDLLEGRDANNPISREFHVTIANLRKIWTEAHRIPCETMGTIEIGCARTMLRQTEIICIEKADENDADDKAIWCWVTVTMPPKRAAGESLSLECRTTSKGDNSLADWTNTNFNESWRKSSRTIRFDDRSELPYFYMEKPHAEKFWQEKREQAVEAVRRARGDGGRNGVLIEVAAQHPLTSDGVPGEEFARRLDMGYELYQKQKAEGKRCKLYVPGSLHMYHGIKDPLSLSEAGRHYLLEKGVPSEDIYGEPQNKKYRGEAGVYNSADECFVASKLWEEEKFSDLFCVCSPVQSMRKTAHYLAFGVFPMVFTCPGEELFHDYVYEIFTALPYVLYQDPYLDPEESELAKKQRRERMPAYVDGRKDVSLV